MPTPTHCVICHVVLTEDTPSGLCPTCLRSGTPREPSSLLLTEDHVATLTLGDRYDVAAETRTGPPTADPALASHRVPPGFVPLALLGHGGMGLVYQVWEPAADRVVALKLIRAVAAPDLRARFGVEVKALAGLAHPNIVRILAVDLLAADPYFTMEFIDGPGLDRRIKDRGPFPAAEAARLIETVARAVHAANEASVIHRDLKPSNVLIGSDGVPKVTDFGVAKRDGLDDDLTESGVVVGTPAYMSPEQACGKKATPAADVYGLGATLYALLTGHAPFQGSQQADILAKVRNEDPPLPRTLRPDVPPGLEGIVLKCLAKEPMARYATAADVADDLAAWQAGEAVKAPPAGLGTRARRWVRSRRKAVVWAGVIVLIGLTVAIGTANAIWLFGPPVRDGEKQPEPDSEFIAQAKKDVAAGKAVTLVGETGLPKWWNWRLGSGAIKDPNPGKSACELKAADGALLELFPDPGIDRYTVTAEFRQRAGARGAIGPDDEFGLYLGADPVPGPNGSKTYEYVLAYTADHDAVPGAPADRRIEVRGVANLRANSGQQTRNKNYLGEHKYPPDLGEVRPWRTVEAAVTPDRVTIRWRDVPGQAPVTVVDLAKSALAANAAELREQSPTALVREWSPRRPIGVSLFRATVEVRNVVLTPSPP